ncbi:hypothetical protein QUF70_04625 [Desulfobacterales bacterium HSG17]|nr:hypothetical protein [Desulfobacterales bacterium HSG17]
MSPLLIEELARQRQADIAQEFLIINMRRQAKKCNCGLKLQLLYITGKI